MLTGADRSCSPAMSGENHVSKGRSRGGSFWGTVAKAPTMMMSNSRHEMRVVGIAQSATEFQTPSFELPLDYRNGKQWRS